MQTKYDTDKDQQDLAMIFGMAIMQTEAVIFNAAYQKPMLKQYRNIVIARRRRIYEFLGQEDVNQPHMDRMLREPLDVWGAGNTSATELAGPDYSDEVFPSYDD